MHHGLTKIYHERKHSSLGVSPLQKFKEGIMGTDLISGKGVPPRIFQERRVRLDFMPYIERYIQTKMQPVKQQKIEKEKMTMGNDIETSELL